MRPLRSLSLASLLVIAACAAGCTGADEPAAAPAVTAKPPAPADPQHAGINVPHGDHTPHKGGVVMMNGDMHFEVVFKRDGQHQLWFSDSVRSELPASVATGVTMKVAREGAPPEMLTLTIDESGESWQARGKPVEGEGVMVTVAYKVENEPYEIELPFYIPPTTTP